MLTYKTRALGLNPDYLQWGMDTYSHEEEPRLRRQVLAGLEATWLGQGRKDVCIAGQVLCFVDCYEVTGIQKTGQPQEDRGSCPYPSSLGASCRHRWAPLPSWPLSMAVLSIGSEMDQSTEASHPHGDGKARGWKTPPTKFLRGRYQNMMRLPSAGFCSMGQ